MKSKLTLAFYTLLFSIGVSFTSINSIYAQENGIYEISSKSEISKSTSKKSENINRDDFYELAFKLYATSYVENNQIKKNKKSQTSTKLTFKDTKSFGILNNNTEDFSDIEIITILLKNESDLSNKMNIINTNNFESLKYIFIYCHFKCTEQQINSFINTNSSVRVFYKIENPS